MSDLFNFINTLPAFLLAIVIHEVAHGWAANRLGDTTAKDSDRLTLNPLNHIDPIGTIFLPLFLLLTHSPIVFGWAKPVPVNFYNLRHPKRDMILVGLAGPIANFLAVIVFTFIAGLHLFTMNSIGEYFLYAAVKINLILGLFNLIPIPPLDGSRVLMGLLPRKLAYYYSRLEPYGFIILILLLFLLQILM